jgi:hypothetical protein
MAESATDRLATLDACGVIRWSAWTASARGARLPIAPLAGSQGAFDTLAFALAEEHVGPVAWPSGLAADGVIMRRRDEENVGQVGNPARR